MGYGEEEEVEEGDHEEVEESNELEETKSELKEVFYYQIFKENYQRGKSFK